MFCRCSAIVEAIGLQDGEGMACFNGKFLTGKTRMISHCGLRGNTYFCESIFKKMGQKAISIDEQIQLLRSRGMVINNEEKAKEVLFDVGYFRLGFYWFPFELTYPQKDNRNHQFKQGSNFDDAVKLYYFDFKLRNYLLKALAGLRLLLGQK